MSINRTPSEIDLYTALNKAITAADHIRRYMPDDEKLTDADRLAIALLEAAKKTANSI